MHLVKFRLPGSDDWVSQSDERPIPAGATDVQPLLPIPPAIGPDEGDAPPPETGA